MQNFEFHKTKLEGVLIIEQKVFGDSRGYFFEAYNLRQFKEAGFTSGFVQDNQSFSTKGVLRGLHFQTVHPQGKLVRVIKGTVFDVAVDINPDSPTFKEWVGVELSEENKLQFYIPEGYAHGFLVLSDEAIFTYKCTDFYYPQGECGIKWDDPDLNISWPLEAIKSPILSEKDKNNLLLSEYLERVKFES